MAISYIPLEVTLIRRQIKREQLIRDGVIGRNTAAKFRKGEYVSLEVIDRLCTYLDCRIEEVVEHVKSP